MKKYSIIVTVLVLTAALLTGCRRPGVQPTELPPTQGPTLSPTTMPTTMPTTLPATVPTELPTDETAATGDERTESSQSTGAADSGRINRKNQNSAK